MAEPERIEPASDLLAPDAQVERLWTGAEWGEGPVWLPAERALRWSDIPNNRILQFDATTSTTSVYATEVEYTNGRTRDLDQHVVQCSHGRRRVERDVDGVVTPVVDSFEGRRFNSPNDVVVASDGAIWFTDPPYGLHPSGREGHPGEREYDGCFVFRCVEATGELTPVITDMVHPNGLAFSPDERILYVADTGLSAAEYGQTPGRAQILAWDVSADAVCSNPRFFADPDIADGFRVDVEGRVWTSSHSGVFVYAPDGTELLRIPLPEVVSNLTFGGEDGSDLYVTASTSLYRIRTATRETPRPGVRS
ncbi:gluconolactonase [Frondihabitans sucicola]|uniref:Gluconolactonase n=1 Tax=Frondihabitans sucicola TaxID=1268041 RepID=A0ABN6XU64_9MICO|nr:SMP-30/gluconolactonase/LRE family protein [Frondihabitans sucicola]BDZ48506.1 gluconolactonase [Frondihabitans sucicola]